MFTFVDNIAAPDPSPKKRIEEAILVWKFNGQQYEVDLDRFNASMHKVLFDYANC